MTFRESAAPVLTGEEPADNTIAEEWRPIEGCPDYEVSDLGGVRSLKYGKTRVLRQFLNKPVQGYLAVSLYQGGRSARRPLVHRLVLETFIPCVEGKTEAAHNDGDSLNNRATNLRWATSSENKMDKRRHGTASHPRRRCITLEAALAILRDDYKTSARVLSARYGCNIKNIGHIRRGRRHRKAFDQFHLENGAKAT